MAMTAWSAKVWIRSICLSVKGWTLARRQHEHADRTSLSHQRHAQHRPEPDPVRRLQERVFRVGQHVGHLHDLVIEQYPPLDGAASRRQALALGVRQPIGREIVVSGVVVAFRLLPSDCGHIRLAKLRGRLGQRIEHRLQIERRAADDFQHVRRRRLLLQRLAQFGGARLHLVEQADILDGDHGLVGEGLDKLDLAIRERADFRPGQGEDADRLTLAHERHAQDRREATEFRDLGELMLGVLRGVRNVDHRLFQRRAPDP